MGRGSSNHTIILIFVVVLLAQLDASLVRGQTTRVGFYSKTCPRVESIVRSTVQTHFRSNPTIAPGLLRMHFHDCFVHGCDASILIDGANTEKTAPPNSLLRGYEVIDDAKAKLEAACPGVVSCADILALAARDSVFVTKGSSWQVPTGRRDGRISLASDTSNLPGFRDSVDVQKQKFAEKGLDTKDLVALVGDTPLELQHASSSDIDYTTLLQAETMLILPLTQLSCLNSELSAHKMATEQGVLD
ncbi:cationic peroxidase 2-like [Juglans microcarpa x Juglans regia]|uniref:cationic peroxidase 2-like n=1 Tax=Juglans microcarpa x Juglans regia TaxID=2249226 RepID=UPI001B7E231F|nr:cationic peroxidase 2-like [Juglans microcarpa x Juglans regia]